MNDPIVDEVRRYRMEHTRVFRGDLAAICRDLSPIEKESGHEVVGLAPKKKDRRPTHA